jgi:hypothetical protein
MRRNLTIFTLAALASCGSERQVKERSEEAAPPATPASVAQLATTTQASVATAPEQAPAPVGVSSLGFCQASDQLGAWLDSMRNMADVDENGEAQRAIDGMGRHLGSVEIRPAG